MQFFLGLQGVNNHNALHANTARKTSTSLHCVAVRTGLNTMRTFFQSRPAAQVERSKASRAPSPSSGNFTERDPLDDNIVVGELSELEARALCAREGIPLFWPLRDPDTATADGARQAIS